MAKPDYRVIKQECTKSASRMFGHFRRQKREMLLEICREYYPLGIPGLVQGVEELADSYPYDQDHRLLTLKPVEAVRKGACGFHGHLTAPTQRWFRLALPYFAKNMPGLDSEAVSKLLDDLTSATEWTFRHGHIYAPLYKLYEHILVAGFGCMLITPDKERVARATTLRLGTYALESGADGRVNRMVRKFSWTAGQVLEGFASAAIPQDVKEAAKKGDGLKRWIVYNIIEPNQTGDRANYDPVSRELKRLKAFKDATWRSVYWLEKAKDSDPQSGVLQVSAYDYCPLIAPRLDFEIGDTYGRGRGQDGLDLARGAQSFKYDILNISGRRSEPPVVASTELKDEGLSLARGAVNYARFGESREALVMPAIAQMPDTGDARECLNDAGQEIGDLFFNSSFATIDAMKNNPGVKTATEVDALIRENMERLNPIITNLDAELLDPLVYAIAHLTVASGAISHIENANVKMLSNVTIEYVSQIHLAAKRSQIGTLDAYLERIVNLAKAKSETIDNVNMDVLAADYAEMMGVPMDIINSEEERTKIRDERAKQEAAMARMEQLKAMGETAGKVGAIPTDPQHAGGAIAQSITGGVPA